MRTSSLRYPDHHAYDAQGTRRRQTIHILHPLRPLRASTVLQHCRGTARLMLMITLLRRYAWKSRWLQGFHCGKVPTPLKFFAFFCFSSVRLGHLFMSSPGVASIALGCRREGVEQGHSAIQAWKRSRVLATCCSLWGSADCCSMLL